MSDTEHSTVVGGSSAYRVISCPASISLCTNLPPEPYNEAAETGTALHKVMEELTDIDPATDDPFDYKGKLINNICITKALIEDKINPALDFFFDIILDEVCPDKNSKVHNERKVSFKGRIDGAFGTADIVFSSKKDNRYGVADYKFGDGVLVQADDNYQMKFYIAAAINDGLLPEGKEYDAFIFQPAAGLDPDDYVKHAVFTWEEIEDFTCDLEDAVNSHHDGTAKFNVGEHCKYCPGKIKCAAFQDRVSAISETSIPDMSNKELAEEYLMLPVYEKYVKQVKALVKDNMASGVHLPGLMLDDTALGDRYWKDEQSASNAVGRLGLPMAERTNRALKSPAQVEKLLKELGVDPERIKSTIKRHTNRDPAAPRIKKVSEEDQISMAAPGTMKAVAQAMKFRKWNRRR